MQQELEGHVALFTGAVSPITVSVARWLGNEGVRLVFAGPDVSRESLLEPLVHQFRRDILCMEAAISDVAAVKELVSNVEFACGRVDMLFHTLGIRRAGGPVDAFSIEPGASLAARNSAPLLSALTYSSAAIRHMARLNRGHVIHLVTQAEVGAIEVEEKVLERVRGLMTQQGSGGAVRMSAIYFDGAAARQIAASAPGAAESRLMDGLNDRLIEEDGWIGRVMTERAIGDMVRQVCRDTPPLLSTMESIDFHGGVHPSIERHAIQ